MWDFGGGAVEGRQFFNLENRIRLLPVPLFGNVVLIGKATDWKSAVWKYYFHVEVRVLPFP